MKKKWFVCVLPLCLAVLLVGCAKESGSNSGGTVKLTALVQKHSLTKDVNTMQWLTDVQKASGVSVEWQQISADWDQKKSALFASGDIPDMLFCATADSDYTVYNGLFADLGPLIDEYAPNIKRMFEEHPEIKTLATQLDGKIYGLPGYKGVWPDSTATMFINKTWLDKVGKAAPATWAELKDVLIAFRDNDVNGDGDKNDEIPMDFNPMGWEYTPKHLLGGLGLPLTNNGSEGYFAEDAKIKNFYVDERYKKLLLFLRDLYAEGLINTEVATQDYSQYQSLARNDNVHAKVGFTWGWESSDRFGDGLKGQYISLPQLTETASSNVTKYWTNDHYYQNYTTNRFALSAKAKNKEAAIKFIDAFYDPKVSIQVLWGGMNDTDKGIRDNGDGSYTILPSADPAMDPGSWKWSNTFADNGAFYIADSLKLTLGTDMQTVLQEKSVYTAELNAFNPKTNVYPSSFMKYTSSDISTLAMNQANINNITDQRWATWMIGQGNIDAEWDAYVQSVLDTGLTQNLEIRQKAYDAYLKTLN